MLKTIEMKNSPLKRCIKCQTTIHVGIAKSAHYEDIIVCLSCLYDKKHRLFRDYNIWGVISEQRQVDSNKRGVNNFAHIGNVRDLGIDTPLD